MWVTTLIHQSVRLWYNLGEPLLSQPQGPFAVEITYWHSNAILQQNKMVKPVGGISATDESLWRCPSFLEENPDLAPATRRKLLSILQDSQKNSKLQLELAAVIDAGEPFVKATYKLEGDGALVFSCFDVLASLEV